MQRLRKRACSSLSPRRFAALSQPGTPGRFTEDVNRSRQAATFLGASPSTGAKLQNFRRLLFMAPITRQDQKKASQTESSRGTSETNSLDHLDDDPLSQPDDDNLQEQQEATPRRGEPARGQQPQRRERERPEVEDILTQLTQVLLEVRRYVVAQQPP